MEVRSVCPVQVPQKWQGRGICKCEELIPGVFQMWIHGEGESSKSGGLLLRTRGMRARGERRSERQPRDKEARRENDS